MRPPIRHTPTLLVALVCATLALPALGQSEISQADGPVEIGLGDPPAWQPAKAGDSLAAGDSVRTGVGGRAEIRLGANVIRVYENSLLRLPTDMQLDGGPTRVRMERGNSIFDVFKRSPRQQFEVETPEVVVMVKGTRFSVAVDGATPSVAVYRGTVAVRGDLGGRDHEVLVRAGFALDTRPDAGFELTLNRAPDPWQSWSQGGAPPAPTVRSPRASSEPSGARAAARHAAASEVQAMTDASAEGGSKLERLRAEREATSDLPPASIDPMDFGDTRHAASEAFTENVLGDSFNVTVVSGSGGPGGDYLLITGPLGINKTLDDDQLEQIIDGDLSPYGGLLLNYLINNQIDPTALANQLEELL